MNLYYRQTSHVWMLLTALMTTSLKIRIEIQIQMEIRIEIQIHIEMASQRTLKDESCADVVDCLDDCLFSTGSPPHHQCERRQCIALQSVVLQSVALQSVVLQSVVLQSKKSCFLQSSK